MKKTRASAYIAGVILATLAVSLQQDISVAVTDRTVAVSGTATKPVTPGALLDDFRYSAGLNLWSCRTATWGGKGGTCAASYTGNPAITYGGTGYSLQLDYNVDASESYAGYSSLLGSQSIGGYTTVSFRVKGGVGGELIKVEMKNALANTNRNHAAVYVADFLDGGVTTSWRQVTIPLRNFANISDWSAAIEFVITFENTQGALNGSPTHGTVYIDDIAFGTDAVPVLRIDHYGDKVYNNSLGGNMGSDGGSGGAILSGFVFNSAIYNGYPNGLHIGYNLSNAGTYMFVYNIFGGGADGDQKIPQNLSSYNYISFWIRASTAGDPGLGAMVGNPGGIKIELHDTRTTPDGQPFYAIAKNDPVNAMTTSWKNVKLPLSSFKDYDGAALNKSAVTELVFTLESGNCIDKKGTIFIDRVQFEQ